MADSRTHRLCMNYAPVDVTRGLCHDSGDAVPADGEACGSFEARPVCALCSSYSAAEGQPYLGVCGAEGGSPMTYPDLNATTCGKFRWKA